MKALVGIGLLASAFAPMVALLAVVRLDVLGSWALVVLGGCALAVLLLVLVLHDLRRWQRRDLQCHEVRRADDKVLEFTTKHLVPAAVVAFGPATITPAAAAVGLVVILSVIYVRGELYYLNPVLALAGFRLFEVKQENRAVVRLLSRRRHLRQDAQVRCCFLTEDIAFELGDPHGR